MANANCDNSLIWNPTAEQKGRKLSADILKLIASKSLSDFTIISRGGTEFPTYKMLLAARSEFFLGMFSNDCKEVREGKVTIDNFDPEVVNIFLEYLTTDHAPPVQLVFTDPLHVYSMAHQYRVQGLADAAKNIIKSSIMTSPESWFRVMHLVQKYQEEEELFSLAVTEFVRNKKDIMASEKWGEMTREWLEKLMSASIDMLKEEKKKKVSAAVPQYWDYESMGLWEHERGGGYFGRGRSSVRTQRPTMTTFSMMPESTFAEDLKKLISTESPLCDFTIICQGTKFPTYKLLLAARSEEFLTMFTNDCKEVREGKVTIDNCDLVVVKLFLEFLVTDKVSSEQLKSINNIQLYSMTHRYKVAGLWDAARNHLIKHTDCQNWFQVLDLAEENGDEKLFEATVIKLVRSKKDIMTTEEWGKLGRKVTDKLISAMIKRCSMKKEVKTAAAAGKFPYKRQEKNYRDYSWDDQDD